MHMMHAGTMAMHVRYHNDRDRLESVATMTLQLRHYQRPARARRAR